MLRLPSPQNQSLAPPPHAIEVPPSLHFLSPMSNLLRLPKPSPNMKIWRVIQSINSRVQKWENKNSLFHKIYSPREDVSQIRQSKLWPKLHYNDEDHHDPSDDDCHNRSQDGDDDCHNGFDDRDDCNDGSQEDHDVNKWAKPKLTMITRSPLFNIMVNNDNDDDMHGH